jgi:antitoxin component YwqK of YwqJK toxin-antitoxin module
MLFHEQDDKPRIRLKEELLDWDEDLSVLDGVPFTGIGYLEDKNGHLISEIPYLNGFPEGCCKKWFANGQLKMEWFAVHGNASGKVTEWYENGVVRSIGIYEQGVELEYTEWDTNGDLVTKRTIKSNSPLKDYLKRVKKKEGK